MTMFSFNKVREIAKSYRKSNKLTQQEFADKAGISVRTYQNLEHGEKLDIENIEKVLNATECDLVIVKRM